MWWLRSGGGIVGREGKEWNMSCKSKLGSDRNEIVVLTAEEPIIGRGGMVSSCEGRGNSLFLRFGFGFGFWYWNCDCLRNRRGGVDIVVRARFAVIYTLSS